VTAPTDGESSPTAAGSPGQGGPGPATDPTQLLRERSYVLILLLGALVGVPVAAIAYGFLGLSVKGQEWVFDTLPGTLGFDTTPAWWPIPFLVLGGLLVALAIDKLPGTGGHVPADGFESSGPPAAAELPGVVLAALASLVLGAVVGPEAPLIAIGSGFAVLIVRLVKKDAPAQAVMVIGAAGSFAAVSTLLGSPILGAFLLMEVAGLAGPTMGVVLVPGLLAAGVGSLIFLGLNAVTGLGTFDLAVEGIPAFTEIRVSQFLWAIAIGLLAAALGTAIKLAAQRLEPIVSARRVLFTPLVGLGVALSAVAFDVLTDKGSGQVLFSGEDALGPLILEAESWTVWALVALVGLKSLAYCLSLSAFRGGPTFPAMFIGAAGGIALSHLAGLPMIAGVAMGIGAMAVTMLGLPLTSVLLTAVFLQADEIALMPLIIVAVVVAYVASVRLMPVPSVAGPAGPPRPDDA
jgi:H+/Cl- antiporter ClcA